MDYQIPYKNIYFIGIGGIGMSAIAKYFLSRGCIVKGYDKTPSVITLQLEKEGASIQFKEDVSHMDESIDLVIWTPAIPRESPLLSYCIQRGWPLLKRSQVLGLISKHSEVYGVAGTHGKTTTSSILTHLMWSCGLECSAFLGGIALNFNSNYVESTSNLVVMESDEYDRSFLQLTPKASILTSMDPDHLDIYGNAQNLVEGYLQYCKQVDQDGILLIHHSLIKYFENWQGARLMTYGIEFGDLQAINVGVETSSICFDLILANRILGRFSLPYPGRHNVENALAAIGIVLHLGAKIEDIQKGLISFKGVQRRFQTIVRQDSRVFIDDYAHHPSELNAAIQAAREFYPGEKLLGIFQPHLFSRTRDFVDEFAESLDMLDEAILLPIYPARESPIEGVTSRMIFDRMKLSEKAIVEYDDVVDFLKSRTFNVLLTLGAGDIDRKILNIKKEIFGDLN
jgi:UDP-N-acetylmuramate--alanine ligase